MVLESEGEKERLLSLKFQGEVSRGISGAEVSLERLKAIRGARPITRLCGVPSLIWRDYPEVCTVVPNSQMRPEHAGSGHCLSYTSDNNKVCQLNDCLLTVLR